MNMKSNRWQNILSLFTLSLLGALVSIFPYTSLSTIIPERMEIIIRIGIIVFFLFMAIVLYFQHIQSIPFHADQFYSSGIFINRYQFLKRGYQTSFVFFITSSALFVLSLIDILPF